MALFQAMTKKYKLSRTRAALNNLSDRQLEDIGLCRADVRLGGPTAWFPVLD